MSYLRGKTYIWSDGERFHVWVADGEDSWNESVWAEGNNKDGEVCPGGVSILEHSLDEFTVMRFAELIDNGLLDSAIDRALNNWKGNFGCMALERNAVTIKSAFKNHE